MHVRSILNLSLWFGSASANFRKLFGWRSVHQKTCLELRSVFGKIFRAPGEVVSLSFEAHYCYYKMEKQT